jgi:hypothetical protein
MLPGVILCGFSRLATRLFVIGFCAFPNSAQGRSSSATKCSTRATLVNRSALHLNNEATVHNCVGQTTDTGDRLRTPRRELAYLPSVPDGYSTENLRGFLAEPAIDEPPKFPIVTHEAVGLVN